MTALLKPCTSAEYHADHRSLGSSMMKTFRDNPLEYRNLYITHTQLPDEPSPEMKLGTLAHLFVLEPSEWEKSIAVLDEFGPDDQKWDRRRTIHKHAIELETKAAAGEGKELITHEQMQSVLGMARAINANASARSVLASCRAHETSIFWDDEVRDLALKCRLDAMRPGLIVDLKTTGDISEEAFSRSIGNRTYHRQAAHYCEGYRQLCEDDPEFIWIAATNVEPYECQVYQCHPDDLAVGHQQNQHTLDLIRRAMDRNDWNRVGHGAINILRVPGWALAAA